MEQHAAEVACPELILFHFEIPEIYETAPRIFSKRQSNVSCIYSLDFNLPYKFACMVIISKFCESILLYKTDRIYIL
ncbi:hypothetical protein [Leptospira interrogans]|uniref:hypothetical protein n=1 Tax=Leptospira interrogans TaxID=173 RepID=UPI0007738F45|nr:hypothetical protein [Leptospira interrogans]